MTTETELKAEIARTKLVTKMTKIALTMEIINKMYKSKLLSAKLMRKMTQNSKRPRIC